MSGAPDASWAARLFIQLIKGYQYLISPLLPPTCRFSPSCSSYSIEAVKHYGILRGGLKSIWRILRCHPLSRGGYDPLVCNSRETNGVRHPSES